MNNNYRALIFLIKRYKLIVFCWALLSIAACFLLLYDIPCGYFVLPYIYVFAAYLLFYCGVILFMANQFKKINSILFTGCDPLTYIDIYNDIIDASTKTKRPLNVDRYRLNLSAGLIAAGRHDEAYDALIKFKSFKNNRAGKLGNVVYYNNLCSVCLKLGRTDEAKYYLDCLAGCVAVLSPKDNQKYSKYVNTAKFGVNIEKGVFDNAENFYNEVFNKATSNYEKVNAKFRLGKVHLHFGDTARAKEAFEYVVSHGNKLHIVEEAKEYLKQMSK